MNRRHFLRSVLGLVVSVAFASEAAAANKNFIFKIKTKSGGIVGNILIEAKDLFAAISKLKQRYPDCEILEAKEK